MYRYVLCEPSNVSNTPQSLVSPPPLMISQDPKDPYLSAYNEERILMITDQEPTLSEEELVALQTVREQRSSLS